jgi:hypothetical protein
LYAYVRNNPLRGIDRNGRSSLCINGANCPGNAAAISQGELGNATGDAGRTADDAARNQQQQSPSAPAASPSSAAAVAGIVGPPFVNQAPEFLDLETSIMNELGVTPLSPGDPAFLAAAEQAGGQFNWVVTTSGELLTTPAIEGVSHAATAGGADVAGAGMGRVIDLAGETAVRLDGASGHYLNGASAEQTQAAITAGKAAFSGFFTVLSDFVGVFIDPKIAPGFHDGCPPGGCDMN